MAPDHDLSFVEKCFSTAQEFLVVDYKAGDDGDHIFGSTPVRRNNRKSQRGKANKDTFNKEKKNC